MNFNTVTVNAFRGVVISKGEHHWLAIIRLDGSAAKLADRDLQSLIDTIDNVWGENWYDIDQAFAQSDDPELRSLAY